jgi:hypothetical protein
LAVRNVVVVFEGTKARAVFDLSRESPEDVVQAFRGWLASAVTTVQLSGVCKSFGVGIHVSGADCDHERAMVRR